MSKFNKFLKTGEVLRLVIEVKKRLYKSYFIFILICGAFFILFPMWHIGRQGFFLWLVIFIFLLFLFANSLLEKIYLLTDRNIIFLKALNKNYYIKQGSVRLDYIQQINKKGKNNIVLQVRGREIYLLNIKDRDNVYSKLESLIISHITKKS